MLEVMPNSFIEDEGNEDRDRQRDGDDEDAAEVPEEDDVGERHEDDLLDQGVPEGADGALDQTASVIKRARC